MKKLKLRIEDLSVDSFDSTPAAGRRGTAFGQESSIHPSECGSCLCEATAGVTCGECQTYSCPAENTCAYPCPFSYMTNCHRC